MNISSVANDRPSLFRRATECLVRNVLHLYWRFSRGMTVGVRAAVIDEENRVFLIRHTYVPGWHLPGGGVETSEPAHEALRRELQEEACIELLDEPRWHGIFLNRNVSNRDHVLVYVVRRFKVTRIKEPDREIAEAGFFPLDALPAETTAATRRRLVEITRGEPTSPYW